MNKLTIPLSAVAERNGFSFEERVTEEVLRPAGVPPTSLITVDVAGTVSAVDSEYLFRGRLSGVFERPCDRCLEPAQEIVEQEVVWFFEPGVEAGDSVGVVEYTEEDAFEEDEGGRRVRFFEGDELDLAPHVWEEMVLEAPMKFYCTEACKGLCPRCGANLNEGDCACTLDEGTGNTGLAVLKDLFPDAPPEPPED